MILREYLGSFVMRNALLASLSIFALVACKSDGGGGGASGVSLTTSPTSPGTGVLSQALVTGASDWMRGYVTTFSDVAVQAVRESAGFMMQERPYELQVSGHPYFSEAMQLGRNAFVGAGLDYAHSTGLTGKGQLIALIDDGLRLDHEMFEGKQITLDGENFEGDHGTGVAAVAAGVDASASGGGVGFAPGADLYMATIDYDDNVSWGGLALKIERARKAGAVVLGNSWGVSSTYAGTDYASMFGTYDGQNFVAKLQDFAKTGVIVFAASNRYSATSAGALAALPLVYDGLEDNWITVINILPEYDVEGVFSATRIGSACLEAARFCMAANGQLYTASAGSDVEYSPATGASYAQPQISGAIALLAEAFPDLSPSQLRDRLLATADNGWYEVTGVVDFGDGIQHGYNDEFGHGMLNLKAALLPIGEATVALSGGEEISITEGEVLAVAGPLVGDAVIEALGSKMVAVSDDLHGTFEVPAINLIPQAEVVDLTDSRLNVLLGSDLSFGRVQHSRFMRTGKFEGVLAKDLSMSSLTASGQALTTVPLGENISFTGVDAGDDWGASFSQTWSFNGWAFSLGSSSYSENGSVFGITFPNLLGKFEADYQSLDFSLSQRLSNHSAIHAYGEIGVASPNVESETVSFSNLFYNSYGVRFDLGGVFASNDVLSVSLDRPTGITRGHLVAKLPTGRGSYEDMAVNLSPSHRQVDLSLSYQAQIAQHGALHVAMRHSENFGHRQSATNDSFVAAIKYEF